MALIRIDENQTVKKIKPMHGGGQPPLGGDRMVGYFHYMTEAGIPFSRLHDVGGPYGGNRFVDVPNIFRDFDADENDPENYDFAFTDHLIRHLVEAGVEPYYRLGVTIENQRYIKPYRIFPPKSPEKWARICEHIIRHYTEGWADGFFYNIRYWEIWNEPEVQNEMMWIGSDEEFYNLYDVASKHLKSCFPHLKIGGYASCGFYAIAPEIKEDPKSHTPATIPPSEHEQRLMSFFYGFFDYIKKHGSPIDFFSWHSYADVRRVAVMDEWLHGELKRLGYEGLETHLNEWNPYFTEFGTAHHSAEITAMMIAMQHGHTDACMIYDMKTNTAPFCPLFDIRYHTPIHGYYALLAFNELYKLGEQIATESSERELYVLGAKGKERKALLIANLTGERKKVCIEGADITDARVRELGVNDTLAEIEFDGHIENNSVILIEW